MDPTMMNMLVKANQDEFIREAEKQRIVNFYQGSNRSRSLKKLALGLSALGVIVLLVVWAIMII